MTVGAGTYQRGIGQIQLRVDRIYIADVSWQGEALLCLAGGLLQPIQVFGRVHDRFGGDSAEVFYQTRGKMPCS